MYKKICDYFSYRLFEYLNAIYLVTDYRDVVLSFPSEMKLLDRPLSYAFCKLNGKSVQMVFYPNATCISFSVTENGEFGSYAYIFNKVSLILSFLSDAADFSIQLVRSNLWLWWRFDYGFSLFNICDGLSKKIHDDTEMKCELVMFSRAKEIEVALDRYVAGLEKQRALSECLKRKISAY
ncbi:MAG: hypothetical protein ACRCVE_05105 [Plesiomonas sp.]